MINDKEKGNAKRTETNLNITVLAQKLFSQGMETKTLGNIT